MTASPVSIPINPLPREIDVQITIDRPIREIGTDMTTLVFCTTNAPNLPPNNGRVVIGSTADSLIQATNSTPADTVYWAIQAWAQQSPRPQYMAIGQVYEQPVSAQLVSPGVTSFDELAQITDGSFVVTLTSDLGVAVPVSLEGINFNNVTDISTVATAINNAISGASLQDELEAVELYGGRLVLRALNNNKSISYAEEGVSGTDVSVLLALTQEEGAQKWDAYVPQGLVSEIQLIQQALKAAGRPAFVIALDRQWRDTDEQKLVADYCEANVWKMAGTFCTNSPTAYDSADSTNIGYYCQTHGYKSCSTVYSSNPQQYPEIAYVMSLLSINYAYQSKTAKFKGSGITPESITETQYQNLNNRSINVFTRVGNNADFFREGKQGAATWFSDSYYGWCNFREDAQVAILNGLIRRDKTTLDRDGQMQVVNDLGAVGEKYTRNKFLAPREEFDYTLNDPSVVRKAFTIIPSAIWLSDREQRELSPIAMIAYEAGAIHRAVVGISAYN